jgi:FtsP/CotA-like multicopper oxidase with cupredoxin domain
MYKWYANNAGSYWYHAHSRGQIDDGAYGPVIIKPLAGNPKPFHMITTDVHLLEEAEAQVKPLLLSDWRHRPSVPTWDDEVASGIDTAECMDSLLVNGKGRVDCWPRAEIDAFVNPAIAPLLQANGLQLTDKG